MILEIKLHLFLMSLLPTIRVDIDEQIYRICKPPLADPKVGNVL